MATFHPHTQLSPQGVSIIHGIKPLQMSCDFLAKGYQRQRSLAKVPKSLHCNIFSQGNPINLLPLLNTNDNHHKIVAVY